MVNMDLIRTFFVAVAVVLLKTKVSGKLQDAITVNLKTTE